MPKREQNHIIVNEEKYPDLFGQLDGLKDQLNLKSRADVINQFIPKTQDDFFVHQFDEFKKTILPLIPEDSPRRIFFSYLELFYKRGIVKGDKMVDGDIEDFKKEYGGGKYSD